MKFTPLMLVCAGLLLASCRSSDEPVQKATAAHLPAKVTLSSLAASRCAAAGGSVAYSRQLDGSNVGMCQMINGRRCSEQALAEGHCSRF